MIACRGCLRSAAPRLAAGFSHPSSEAFQRIAHPEKRCLSFLSAHPPLCSASQFFPFAPFRCRSFRMISASCSPPTPLHPAASTNPTPAMWIHFESIQITLQPTYMSMYFPAQGLILAAGKVVFGHPWFGLLIVNALMCAAICWMLQAWLPPTWALLGGVIAVLRIGLFSYWINTYSGGGSIATLGAALLLGALPRFLRSPRLRDSLLMGVGIAVLALSRPYEGLLLCLPVGFVLGRWIFFGSNRPTLRIRSPPRRASSRAHCCCPCLAGILRLSRLRESAHSTLQCGPRRVRCCALLHLAIAAPGARL